MLKSLGQADLLILDDWGLEPLDASARHDLLEILEERYGRRSTIVTSQLPVDCWHQTIDDPTPPTPTPSWSASSTSPSHRTHR
jgi:DNA replication protein DnaC